MVRQVDGKKHSGVFFWVRDAWRVKRRHPPVGSNRDLALLLTRFLVLLTLIIAALMVQTGFLLEGVSFISAAFAGFWVVFLTTLYLLWERLPLNVVRGALFLALALYQIRWASASLILDPREVPVATIASLLYTPHVADDCRTHVRATPRRNHRHYNSRVYGCNGSVWLFAT